MSKRVGEIDDRTKMDTRLKDFWRSNDRFADLFNAVVFNGREMIKPEMLQEMDTDVSGIIQFKGYTESLERARDVVKKMAYGVEFAVLGIESQQKIHYAMPLRTLLYNGLAYLKEYQGIAQTRKEDKEKKTVDEFLSKMRKEGRLHPIISIVIYYSEDKWDGPLCLKDMMAEMPEEIERIFSDYKMNLVQVNESDQYQFHNEDVKAVFEISRELFRGNFDKINELYGNRSIDSELAAVIGKITDTSELIHQYDSEEVKNVACTAVRKLAEDKRNEGYKDGRKEVVLRLLKKGKSIQETADLLDFSEKEVSDIIAGVNGSGDIKQ